MTKQETIIATTKFLNQTFKSGANYIGTDSWRVDKFSSVRKSDAPFYILFGYEIKNSPIQSKNLNQIAKYLVESTIAF